MPFKNPIIPGSNPDPSIIRVGKDFFLVTSTFEYTPGAPIYHSTDLIKWELIGHALTRPSQLNIQTPEPGGGIWATTLRYHDGVFYILAASFTRYRPQEDDRVWPRGFYVSTRDIWDSDSWSDPVWFDAVGFDQDLFWDSDGQVYHSSTYRKLNRTPTTPPNALKDFGIHICTIDLATGRATSTPKLIRESPSGVSEGSHILKRGKYYYLFTAEGGTESGHCEWVLRSETSPFGPWEVGPNNPLWRNGVTDEIQNTGHGDLVEDEQGRWWIVFLGVRPVKRENGWEDSVFGRETFLTPLEWTEDDWPVVNGGEKITLHNDTPSLYTYDTPLSFRDDFKTEKLQLGWYRKNTPPKKDYTLLPEKGILRLHGAPYTLSTPACPTLFLRKQTHRFGLWETRLSFLPNSGNVEAASVVYLNYYTWVSVGVRLDPDSAAAEGGKRVIRFTTSNIESDAKAPPKTKDFPLGTVDGDVVLLIEMGDRYRFGFREVTNDDSEEAGNANGKVNWVGEVSNRAIVNAPLPIGAPFTGVMLGVYSGGDREAVLADADFKYVEIKEV
ncbi:glycosyl hydrolase [Aspergillus karnatakaensis]|uniref:glycoside hydrolase family 43 protein n=1 Tax=Aspergillus karnatakaensis TaxID=1810916 RepID=UPI003CCCFF3E